MPRGSFKAVSGVFAGLPLIEATADICVVPSADDIKNGKRKHPGHCALVKNAQRTLGATKVVFFRRTAYIDLPDANGVRHVHRFMLHPSTRKFIADFDSGKQVASNVGLRFLAPTEGHTLAASLKRRKAQ